MVVQSLAQLLQGIKSKELFPTIGAAIVLIVCIFIMTHTKMINSIFSILMGIISPQAEFF
ncbi:MAG: hypothetical protein VZR23_07230 [Lachnospiraceae bacterium]|nr:hypothetical protein [Lachnospiraceae bacterium]